MAAHQCPTTIQLAQDIERAKRAYIANEEKRPVIVIGDPHGANAEITRILEVEKMVDVYDNFIGKDTIVVIMGDLMHRGPNSIKVVENVLKWKRQAPAYGSNVHTSK